MLISLIAAMARNRVIGRDNRIPWRLPGEQRRFRRFTEGHAVLMGRKTCESIGRPLPRRTNIVLTRRPGYQAPGCLVARDLDDALRQCPEGETEAFIIGGEALYIRALPRADRIYLSILHREVEGDTYFPEFSPREFREVESELIEGEDPYTFALFERIGNETRPATKSGSSAQQGLRSAG